MNCSSNNDIDTNTNDSLMAGVHCHIKSWRFCF